MGAVPKKAGAVRASGAVQALRHFNRYYTNLLGLLSRSRFDTNLTLTESRVIFEIGRRGEHTQSALRRDLKIDMGYLNRVVKGLAARGFVSAQTDIRDNRVSQLALTPAGMAALEEINAASDSQARDMMRGMNGADARALVSHLREVQLLLERKRPGQPRVVPAAGEADIAAARTLMREYAKDLGVDLSFQGFDEELAGLPGKYAGPSGALFIAWVPRASRSGGIRETAAGCVALRKLSAGTCEMKRLFVRPGYRGRGIGRMLAERIIQEAKDLGYRTMRLDTLDKLESAVSLYQALGFVRIRPYCPNPLAGAMFWEKKLRAGPRTRLAVSASRA